MLRSFAIVAVTLSPILAVAVLLELAAWRERRRQLAIAHQIVLTDTLARDLGASVAPTVRKSWAGPWEIEIPLPSLRPATAGVMLAVVQQALAYGERLAPARYRVVLTPREDPATAPVRLAPARRYAEVRS